MRRLLSILAVVAVCAATLVLTAARSEEGGLKTYEIVVDNAFGLVEGGDLKIGGVKAGETTGFKLTGGEGYKVAVQARITEPGFDSLREDARCDVRQQSLIGEYFIDCDLGKSKKELPDGGRVPITRTSSTIPPDLIQNVMRRPYRERLRLIINELGTGLAGRPEELNEVIRRAHPGLRETSQTIAILRQQYRTIRDFITDADEVSRRVEPVKEDLAKWARESSETAGIQSSRSEELGRYWNRLPDFLAELEPTMEELGATADRQVPTLRKLGGAAPELDRFLQDVQPFARASRNSIDDLGEAAAAGRSAIGESRQEIRELRKLSVNAPKLGKPLRQFLQSIDDRRRSTENDPAAAKTAPPPPDKTAYKAGQGFTGMEALWNYLYYQALAINVFDEFGHLLRIAAFTGGACSPYAVKPDQELIDQCKSWTGPNQPGVNAPDPTEGGNIAKVEAAERRNPTKAVRERKRGPGDPEAPPTPGKPDPSKPQIVIPEDIRRLLDRVGKTPREVAPQLPQLGGRAPQSDPTQLLDYLLAP